MTINSRANKTIVSGDGAQTQFAFSFVGVAAAYIGVILTDAGGNATPLTMGAGASQYQIVLNAPVPGAIWGLGGTVTYDPGGTPIPAGSTLTIYRTLPLTQAISLQNQSSMESLGNGAETGLDTLEMQLQQTAEGIDRAIVAPIVDPSTINLTLPPAAQRANKGLAFDSQGNVIAGALPSSGVISSAMQPVVSAATLALGRAAFGLGDAATLDVGAGLIDDGAGAIRVNSPVVQIAASQGIPVSFDLERIVATGPIYLVCQPATVYWSGWGFWLEAVGDDVTVVPNFTDRFDGYPTGVAFTVPAGATVFITTDAAGAGTWYVDGLPWLVQNPRSVSGNYAVTRADNGKILKHNSGAFGTFVFPPAANLPANFRCMIINGETGPIGKGVGGTDVGSFTQYPGQSYLVINDNGVVRLVGGIQVYKVSSLALFCNGGVVSPLGSDDPLVADGLGPNARAYRTLNRMRECLYQNFNHNGSQPVCTAKGTFNESVTFGGQPVNTGVFFFNGSAPGEFIWRPTNGSSSFCSILGDGCIVEMANVWFDGNGLVGTAVQVHQTAIWDILSGCSFGSFGNPNGSHIATDGAGWTINLSASYAVTGAGGAAVHVAALGSGVINVSGLITVTITGTPNIGKWFQLTGPNLVNCGSSITFSGAVLAGCQKWTVGAGATLSLAGNAANIPGSLAGNPAVGVAPGAGTGWVLA